jgi:hypothetical protein
LQFIEGILPKHWADLATQENEYWLPAMPPDGIHPIRWG